MIQNQMIQNQMIQNQMIQNQVIHLLVYMYNIESEND